MASESATAARNIKRELAAAFPGVSFGVRSKQYAGGDSVSVCWELGPTREAVAAIGDRWERGEFDASTDTYEFTGTRVPDGMGAAQYVLTDRDFPDELREQVGRDLCACQSLEYAGLETLGLFGPDDADWLRLHVNRLLHRASFEPGQTYAGLDYGADGYFVLVA